MNSPGPPAYPFLKFEWIAQQFVLIFIISHHIEICTKVKLLRMTTIMAKIWLSAIGWFLGL